MDVYVYTYPHAHPHTMSSTESITIKNFETAFKAALINAEEIKDINRIKSFIESIKFEYGGFKYDAAEYVKFCNLVRKYPKKKFYLTMHLIIKKGWSTSYLMAPRQILTEEEMKAICPVIDKIIETPFPAEITRPMQEFNMLKNIISVPPQVLDMYDFYVKKGVIMA